MRLIIIGAGFAGMYAALSAARLRDIQGVSPEELEIALVAPEPTLVIRPRLYEQKPETLTAPLLDVLKADRCRLRARQRRDDRHQSPHGADHDRQGHAKDAVLRPPGRGHRQPAVPSQHSRPCRTRLQRRPARRRGRARQASARPCRPAGRERARHRRRCRRRLHRHRGGNRDAGTAARRSSARMPRRASSSSTATVRSPPTWAKAPAPSSRTHCASSA